MIDNVKSQSTKSRRRPTRRTSTSGRYDPGQKAPAARQRWRLPACSAGRCATVGRAERRELPSRVHNSPRSQRAPAKRPGSTRNWRPGESRHEAATGRPAKRVSRSQEREFQRGQQGQPGQAGTRQAGSAGTGSARDRVSRDRVSRDRVSRANRDRDSKERRGRTERKRRRFEHARDQRREVGRRHRDSTKGNKWGRLQ